MTRLPRLRSPSLPLLLSLPALLLPLHAEAGSISVTEGNVMSLDDATQVASVAGAALFDEALSGDIPLDLYADQGLTMHVGLFTDIIADVPITGMANPPIYVSVGDRFPAPIAGGGIANQGIIFYGGALTFDDPISQFGLTTGGGIVTYITAYDAMGALIGQVVYEPDEELEDAAFFGIDTMGVPIGLLVIGNDDIAGGEEYIVTGSGTATDTWIWGAATPCAGDEDCLDDMWSCTMRSCIEGACQYDPTMEACDDADACTEMDTCADLACVGTPVNCSDGNVCTFDSCDPTDGCSSEPIEGCCLSDEDCPDGQSCIVASNTCEEGPPPPPPPPPDEEEEEEEEESEESGEETGPAVDDSGEGGCSCSTDDERDAAPIGATLLGLGLLLGWRRRSRVDA